MSNLDIKWEFQCPHLENYHILDRKINFREIIMTHINEDEEKFIDDMGSHHIVLERGKRKFVVSSNQIYCYGDVDFNNKEDLEQIESFNFVTRIFQGFIIPAEYNYDKHVALSDNNKFYKYTETWSESKIAKYAHGCLGKPKKIIIFYNSI